MTWRRGAWWLLLFALVFGTTGLAQAHETRPGYLELREAPDGARQLDGQGAHDGATSYSTRLGRTSAARRRAI